MAKIGWKITWLEEVKKLRGQGNGRTVHVCTKTTKNYDRSYLGESDGELGLKSSVYEGNDLIICE